MNDVLSEGKIVPETAMLEHVVFPVTVIEFAVMVLALTVLAVIELMMLLYVSVPEIVTFPTTCKLETG